MRKWLAAALAAVVGFAVLDAPVPVAADEITVLAGMGVVSGVRDLAPPLKWRRATRSSSASRLLPR